MVLPDGADEPFLAGNGRRSSDEKASSSHTRLASTTDHFQHDCSSHRSPIITHFVVFSVTSLLWGILFLAIVNRNISHVSHNHHHGTVGLQVQNSRGHGNMTTNSRLLTCGNSIAEAKSNDCKYDILSNHWVPESCMDMDAVNEYKTDGSWFGFADENRTELLTVDAMSEMEYYYTSERDHIVHCAMLWRKQFWAFFEERVAMDTIIASASHTMHCSQFLMDMSDKGPDYRNMPIKTWVGYAGCWVRA
ncbi:hypothetical protein CcaCcLH18_10653 [Colletotrichum camelliae]|nr:hypothetical protein CcaCcLH18_10653 [Colletotrichum camelliae]